MTVIPPFVPPIIPSILAWLVILVAVPLVWFEAAVMWRRSLARPDLLFLRVTAEQGLVIGVVVAVFALVFLNNGMEVPIFAPPATMVITRLAILSLAIPGLHFLWAYRRR